jgi:hypothetical protein
MRFLEKGHNLIKYLCNNLIVETCFAFYFKVYNCAPFSLKEVLDKRFTTFAKIKLHIFYYSNLKLRSFLNALKINCKLQN